MEKAVVYPCPEPRAEVLAGHSKYGGVKIQRVFKEITWSESREEAPGGSPGHASIWQSEEE